MNTGTELDPIFLLADTDPEAMKQMNTELIAGFRATGGRLGGPFDGVPLLLLTTTGARFGARRTTPVNYTRDRKRYIVIASKSGAATNPDWYHNLLAHPTATIEVDGNTVEVRASFPQGRDRDRLFTQHAGQLPNFTAYQHRTTRLLPVVVLQAA